MTNWIQITLTDLEDYLVAAQLTALRQEALGDTQDDPVPQIISDISRHVRAEIASCSRNRLSKTTDSVPPELKAATCHLIIEEAQSRIPYLGMTNEQIRGADNARELLQRCASCQFAITQPTDPLNSGTFSTGGTLSVEHSRSTRIRGENLNGL